MGEVLAYVSLLFSLLAFLAAAFCVLRGAPQQLSALAREAFNLADSTRQRYDTFLAEAQTILGAVQEERERATRAQRRASADRVRMVGANNGTGGPDSSPPSREDTLINLRKQAGMM